MKPFLTVCLLGTLIPCFSQNKDSLDTEKRFPKKVNSAFGPNETIKRYSIDSLVKVPLLNEYIVGKWEILPNETYDYPLYINKVEFAANRIFKAGFTRGPKSKETFYWYYTGNSIEIYVNDMPNKLRKMYALKVYKISKDNLEVELNYTYTPVIEMYVLRRIK